MSGQTSGNDVKVRGFPKKDVSRFLKIKDIAKLFSDHNEGKIMKNIDF